MGAFDTVSGAGYVYLWEFNAGIDDVLYLSGGR